MRKFTCEAASALMLLFVVSGFLAGCIEKPGITAHDRKSNIVNLAAAQKMKPATPVTVQGTMVEKCFVAGCWFILRDDTGTIKVDLKATKQTVVSIPLNTQATIRGTIALDGSQKMIRAASATF